MVQNSNESLKADFSGFSNMEIHNFEKKTYFYLNKIRKDPDVLPENKKLLEEFVEGLRSERISWGGIYKYIWLLRYFAKKCKKSFFEITRKDLDKILTKFDGFGINRPWSERTQNDLRKAIKRFYKWLKQRYGDNVKLNHQTIKAKKVNKKRLPSEILTEEEVRTLVNFCDNVRDKALVYVLYESGCRIGELLTLKLKHIQFDNYGAVLMVNGKTGQRRVRIINSAPLLKTWINSHPFKENQEAPLWITENNHTTNGNSRYMPLGYRAVAKLLKKLEKRSGIKKHLHPHLFRHSRATHLAKFLTEAQLKEFFGWTQSSNMASIYVHLSGRDVDQGLLKAYGIETDGEDKLKVELVSCPKCGEKNPVDAVFCLKCGYPLKENLIVQEKRNEKIIELVVKFLQILAEENPRIKKKFYELVKKENALELFK